MVAAMRSLAEKPGILTTGRLRRVRASWRQCVLDNTINGGRVALVSDEAISLSVSDYSETSQIVTLLTLHSGRVRLLAKGSKRPKNAFEGPIDVLEECQAVFTQRAQGGLGQMTERKLRCSFPHLHNDLRAFYAASYIRELLLATMHEMDPHPELYKMLLWTLQHLSCGADSSILTFRFEAALLRLLGLMPELGRCVVCGRPRAAGQRALFNPHSGGTQCRQCAVKQGARGLDVEGKALDALRFLAAADNASIGRVRLLPQTAAEMRKLLRQYWAHVVGNPLRSSRWIA